MQATIECKLKREGGSNVTIRGKAYKFRPDDLGRHVCVVEDKRAIQRFLAIPEAYRLVGDDNDDIDEEILKGSEPKESEGLQPEGGLNDDIVLDDEDIENYEEGEDEDENDPANDLAPTPETSTDDTSSDEDDMVDPAAVKQEWEATFGKKAGKRTTDTMLKQLREADEE